MNLIPYTSDISGARSDSALVEMWLQGRPETTQRAYRADVGQYFETSPPIRLTTFRDLADYANALEGAPSTRRRKLSAIKSLFRFAMRTGYITIDPAAALILPQVVQDSSGSRIPDDVLRRLVLSAKPGRDRLIMVTLAVCGLRESELVALDSTDLSDGVLRVTGKGSKVRHVRIPERLSTALHGDGPLFQSKSGNRLSPSDVYRLVRRCGEAVGIHATPHMLRHTAASMALDRGAPIHLVRRDLGHASLATTSTYAHARPDDGISLWLDCLI